jgi:hypothetical protein
MSSATAQDTAAVYFTPADNVGYVLAIDTGGRYLRAALADLAYAALRERPVLSCGLDTSSMSVVISPDCTPLISVDGASWGSAAGPAARNPGGHVRLRTLSSRKKLGLGALGVGLLAALALPAVLPASAAATRYEAESATLSQAAVATNHLSYSGTGFVDYTNVAGSYVEWTVNAASAGTATLVFGFANVSTANRPMDISVNGTVVGSSVAFNPTTNWDTWATKTVTAAVNAGSAPTWSSPSRSRPRAATAWRSGPRTARP